jgi:hypothetical protein
LAEILHWDWVPVVKCHKQRLAQTETLVLTTAPVVVVAVLELVQQPEQVDLALQELLS